MIFLFTDYGLEGPYIGQVETVLHHHAPNEKVINLMVDAPRNNPKASAYLLAAFVSHIPEGSILFCVVDPGVGSDKDKPVMLKVDGRWFVGPDNGLFDIVARKAKDIEVWEITWEPENLSKSFHGRDLYAPVCAVLANKKLVSANKVDWEDKHNWAYDLNEIIYIDHFGNCMTGIHDNGLSKEAIIKIKNREIGRAETFAYVKVGEAFWYVNSNGLVEIATNHSNAAQSLKLEIGDPIVIIT